MVLPLPFFLQIPPKSPMGPKPSQPQTAELFRPRLDEQINMKHPLVRLAALIDWGEIERTFAASFTSMRGRPVLPPRLVAGLLYLQHTFDASDEAVVNTWVDGNSSAARPTCRPNGPSTPPALRAGESALQKKGWRRCWRPALRRHGVAA